MTNREHLAWIDEEINHGNLGFGWHHTWRETALREIRLRLVGAEKTETDHGRLRRLISDFVSRYAEFQAAMMDAVAIAEFNKKANSPASSGNAKRDSEDDPTPDQIRRWATKELERCELHRTREMGVVKQLIEIDIKMLNAVFRLLPNTPETFPGVDPIKAAKWWSGVE
jgi:hypothetical protein